MATDYAGMLGLLTGVTALIAALTGLFVVIERITNLKNHINSRVDQLMALQAQTSHAEGVKEEHDRAKDIAKDIAKETAKDIAKETLTILPFGSTVVP